MNYTSNVAMLLPLPFHYLQIAVALALANAALTSALAQAPMPIYTDHLVNGFQDWSWGTHNLANTAPVHSGGNSISASLSAWQAVSFYHNDFSLSVYGSFSFWANDYGWTPILLATFKSLGVTRDRQRVLWRLGD